jgi:hypothetical protein
MRKSQANGRRLRAGLVVAATAATVTALTAAPAYAAVTTSLTQVPTQGGYKLTVTDSSTPFVALTNYKSQWITAVSCQSSMQTAGSTVVNGGTSAATSTSVISWTTPVLPSNGNWKMCIYDNAGTTLKTTTDNMFATPWATLDKVSGPSGTANKIVLTAPANAFTGTTTTFNSAGCPATYTAPVSTTIIAAGAAAKSGTTMLNVTTPTSLTAGTAYSICVFAGTTVGSSALVVRSDVTYAVYASTVLAATLTPAGGSSATVGYVTLSAPTDTFVGNGPFGALFSRNSCPLAYAAGAGTEPYAGTVTKINTGKVAITSPVGVVVNPGDATTPWNVCTYADATSGAILTTPATYTVAPVLDLSAVTNASITPAAGPAQGGTKIVISNLAGIPTAAGATLSASLGGVPLTDVSAINSTSIKGTTGQHGAGPVQLSITTAAGTKTTTIDIVTDPTDAAFTYNYGIKTTPNTAAPGSTPTLDITGAGFSSLSFQDVDAGGATPDTKAHVLLTDNAWNQQDFSSAINGLTDTAAITQCKTVLPIQDTELICTLDLANTLDVTPAVDPADVPPGTYTITIVNTGAGLQDTLYNYSVVNSDSTFTVSAF